MPLSAVRRPGNSTQWHFELFGEDVFGRELSQIDRVIDRTVDL